MTHATIVTGDCLEVLRAMPDASVDSIVTDPPYGLSKGQGDAHRIYRILRNIGLPDLADANTETPERLDLSGVPVRCPFLAGEDGSVRELSGVGMPEGSIDFQNAAIFESEVREPTESSGSGAPYGLLPGEPDSQLGECLGDFILDLGDLPAPAPSDLSSRCEPELFPGGFAVPIGAVRSPGGPGFSGGCTVIDFRGDVVRAGNYPIGEPEPPSGVMTFAGAVNALMLRFDGRGRPMEVVATRRADELSTFGFEGCAQLVRARPAAGCLPSMAEAHRVRLIDRFTDGAGSVHHIRLWLPKEAKINAKIPSGGFMGKSWDSLLPDPEAWRECLRVLKPGGHLLAFGGSRTYHRLAVAVEDAGFEIRDQIMWVYGSGFPKSQNVGKAIDKAAGAQREVVGYDPSCRLGCNSNLNDDGWNKIGRQGAPLTAPATAPAKQWDGWGTALKPAHEPIVVARKPLTGTVAANVLAHDTGALNIDGCRVEWPDGKVPEVGTPGWGGPSKRLSAVPGQSGSSTERTPPSQSGRWPANVIHDGSPEVVEQFLETQSGKGNVRKASGSDRNGNTSTAYGAESRPAGSEMVSYGDKGSAARFFYCAKASRKDRGEGNTHPTVKPTDLMAYLCRLVTPPGGTVLDPFAGSGSTGKAATLEGFHFIGIEREEEYAPIIEARVYRAMQSKAA